VSSASAELCVPEALRPGDALRVVAPSSPFEARLVWRALGWLGQRYRVRFTRRIFEQQGFLAGDDLQRREELRAALNEPEVRAIVAVRGGYGSGRYMHDLDWSVLRRSPRWIVGFSDVTAMHLEAARHGVASIHGANLSALGRGDEVARAAWLAALEAPLAPRQWSGLRTLRPGCALGRLWGGNLTIVHSCAASGRLFVPPGCVWLMEDVGERPYRIDRMLTSLLTSGALGNVAAVVAGEFEHCEPGADGVTVEAVLAERLGKLGVPVVIGAPIGHGRNNLPAVLGPNARLEADGAEASLHLCAG
jgi:muramoyltetrapeptide carboxypeptidase